jgi:hypothetical protein
VTHRNSNITRNDYGIDEDGFRLTYLFHKRNPLEQYEVATRFGERHLCRRVLPGTASTDLTHKLTGVRGRSHEAICTEAMAIIDGRGIGVNEGVSA